MRHFDHARFGPVIADLLQDRRVSPLDQGRPDATLGAKLQALDAERLFAPAAIRRREMAEACLAALWLYGDDLDRSHRISQGLRSARAATGTASCIGARATLPMPSTGCAVSAPIRSTRHSGDEPATSPAMRPRTPRSCARRRRGTRTPSSICARRRVLARAAPRAVSQDPAAGMAAAVRLLLSARDRPGLMRRR